MSSNRGICSHVVGSSLTHAAGAMASVATIAVSAVVIAKCASMLRDTFSNNDENNNVDGNGDLFFSKYQFDGSQEDSGKKVNTVRKRGWYVLTGSYTLPRQADPFIGVNGIDMSGVPYDESRLGRGLAAFWVDALTGKMESVKVRGGDETANNGQNINPSYLAIHPNGKIVYACNEVQSFNGQDATGGVSAFEIIEEEDGLSFKFIGSSISHGSGPCMIAIDRTATVLLVANYMGGNLAMIPLTSNGLPRGDTAICHQHFGQGIDTTGRQEAPHAHSVVLDASQSTLLVCDLGTDQIFPYAINASAFSLYPATGTLTLTNDLLCSSKMIPTSDETFSIDLEKNKDHQNMKEYYKNKIKKGFGPRHCVIHPNQKVCFIICEMSSQLLCFEYFPCGTVSLSSSLSSSSSSSLLMPTMQDSSLRETIQSPILVTHNNSPSGLKEEVQNIEKITTTPSGGAGGLGFWSFVSLAQGLRSSNESQENNLKNQSTECASEIVNQMKIVKEEEVDGGMTSNKTLNSSLEESSVVLVDKTPSCSLKKNEKRKIRIKHGSQEDYDDEDYEMNTSSGISSSGGSGDGSFGKLLGCYNLLPEEWEFKQSQKENEFYQFNEGKWAADIMISPSGKFLYATNRLHNTIVTFSIPPSCETCPLKKLGYTDCGGKTPRNFTMSPDGRFMLVAHQHSHTMSSFAVDQSTGSLSLVSTMDAPNVACVKFV